jgi:hypothetical protein
MASFHWQAVWLGACKTRKRLWPMVALSIFSPAQSVKRFHGFWHLSCHAVSAYFPIH